MMTSKRRIPVIWQGMTARALLADSPEGVIAGTTSRGIFIRLDSGWTVFLSYEGFRGPLTLNLAGNTLPLAEVETNSRVTIRGGKVQIASARTEVDFAEAETWEAPPQAGTLLSATGRTMALTAVAGLVLSQDREPGLHLALKDLPGLDLGHAQPLPPPYGRVDFVQLLQRLKGIDLDAIISALAPLLGLGAGLTPAGDDLVLGLVLAYNRWREVLKPFFAVGELNGLLIQAVARMSTHLSANLIACAVQGQADERLITALDGLMTGSPAPDRCADSLSSWGSSSGGDALVGMALAMLSVEAFGGSNEKGLSQKKSNSK